MFCRNCGKEIPNGAKFCFNCGAPAPAPATASPAPSGNTGTRQGLPFPGFSDRKDDPEILAAVKKNRKATWVFFLIIMPLPVIGFAIYGLIGDGMELGTALAIGGAISAVFLVLFLISLITSAADRTYDGVVTDKKVSSRYRSNGSDAGTSVTEYVTYVRTDDGRTKKIIEKSGGHLTAYDYLEIGDRFRYHPAFAFKSEKYIKATAKGIYCAGCGTRNPVESDRCSKCGIPLLK